MSRFHQNSGRISGMLIPDNAVFRGSPLEDSAENGSVFGRAGDPEFCRVKMDRHHFDAILPFPADEIRLFLKSFPGFSPRRPG